MDHGELGQVTNEPGQIVTDDMAASGPEGEKENIAEVRDNPSGECVKGRAVYDGSGDGERENKARAEDSEGAVG